MLISGLTIFTSSKKHLQKTHCAGMAVQIDVKQSNSPTTRITEMRVKMATIGFLIRDRGQEEPAGKMK